MGLFVNFNQPESVGTRLKVRDGCDKRSHGTKTPGGAEKNFVKTTFLSHFSTKSAMLSSLGAGTAENNGSSEIPWFGERSDVIGGGRLAVIL